VAPAVYKLVKLQVKNVASGCFAAYTRKILEMEAFITVGTCISKADSIRMRRVPEMSVRPRSGAGLQPASIID
jgi:hypothetical protein